MKTVIDRIVQYANRYKLTNSETGEVLGTFDFDEITGTVQQVGTEIDKELFDSISADITAEANTRAAADTILQGNIDAEAEARENAVNAVDDKVDAHIANKNNPHSVTKAQVGLGNVADERQYSEQNPPPYPVVPDGTYSGMTVGNATNAVNAQTATNAQQLGGVLADEYTLKTGTYPDMTVGNATNATNADTADSATSAQDAAKLGGVAASNYAQIDGSYSELGAGYLAKNIQVAAGANTAGWWKIGSIDVSKRGSTGSTSTILLCTGLYSHGQYSGIVEVNGRMQSGELNITASPLYLIAGGLRANSLCLGYDGTVITLYQNLDAQYTRYSWTILEDSIEGTSNVDYFELGTSFYGSSAPENAVYVVNRNVARPLFIANQVQAKTPTINTNMALDGGVNPSDSMVGDEVIFYCSGGGNYTCTGKIKSISGTTPTVTITGVVEQQASGGEVTSSGGFQGGEGASASSGGAVGSGTSAQKGGAVGQNASAGMGGAVGYNARATSGGGAVGYNASATSGGGAVGVNASATSGGGAVGNNASATDGFAGGRNAKATADGAVQLGAGTNADENTLQFRGYQIVDASGNIPAERLNNAASPAQVNSVSMVPYGGQATTLSALGSGGVYSISANGYLRIAYQTTAADNFISMSQVDSSGNAIWGALANGQKSYGSGYPFIYMPVAKGDHIKVDFSSSVKIIQVQLIKVKTV